MRQTKPEPPRIRVDELTAIFAAPVALLELTANDLKVPLKRLFYRWGWCQPKSSSIGSDGATQRARTYIGVAQVVLEARVSLTLRA